MLIALLFSTTMWVQGASPVDYVPVELHSAAPVIGQPTGKKKKVIRLEAITVEGRIQKPQAFYILQRSNLNFEELNRTDSFVPKVLKSIDKDPF